MDDEYLATIFDSYDDETQEALREFMNDGYDLEDAIAILDEEGRLL